MSFNSSDIVAIVAIVAVVVSAFVSVMSAYISYKNNKASLDASQQNNKAIILSKRTEFIFEKQMTAFKEVALKMDKIIVIIATGSEQQEKENLNRNAENIFFSNLEKEADVFLWLFNGEKFYFPEEVLSSIADFLEALKKFIAKHDYEHRVKLTEELVSKNVETARLMRIYWGIDEE